MSLLGTRVVRVEDPDLLTIGGKYVDDLAPADAVHATFVRSAMAHAMVTGIDTADALEIPGVIGVYTAADLDISAQPPGMARLNQQMLRTKLATDRVRYVGEPIAVVVSENAAAGADALDMVIVDYEPLPAVVSMRESMNDAVLLFPEAGTNVAYASASEAGDDFFSDCEVRVDLSFVNPRVAPCPLEPRATAAKWSDVDGVPHLTQWATTQGAHGTRDTLAAATGVDASQVRVICPDVGGGFGAKNGGYPEDIVVSLLARHLDRPVRWAESRSESMLGLVHGRACEFDATIGGTRDGRITTYRVHMIQDAGGYPEVGAVLPHITRMVASGVYDIEQVDFFWTSVMTNTMPVGAYRGAGRPEATHCLERMVDAFAAEIGMDPSEVRRLNFVQPDQFPFQTPTGSLMDTGEYEAALDKVLAAVDYDGLRAEQQRRRDDETERRLLGLGWTAYVEIANPVVNGEFGSFELQADGGAVVLTGSSSHGQGHHTAFAQVANSLTGIPFDKIEVRHGDTAEVPRGGGTGGSKSLQIGGTAVYQASEAAVARAKEIAADLLEANPDDVVLDVGTGEFSVTGTPSITKGWADIAKFIAHDAGELLKTEADFKPPGATFPFGVHLSVVEVDRDTGQVTIQRHVACDDAGTLVNPLIVDGQVHGGVASGIAQALMEEFIYDEDGNPNTANFADYGLVSAAELPSFERIEQETPTPRNPLGAKGVGESGTIGATPAVQNAVVDALAHLGVRHVDMPCTAERVWRAIATASN